MCGVSTHIMANVKECYELVRAQSMSIAQLLLDRQYVDWKQFDSNKFTSCKDSTVTMLC